MTTLSITLDGQSYTAEGTDLRNAALGLTRSKVMAQLPPGEGQDGDTPITDRPGYIASDTDYLAHIFNTIPLGERSNDRLSQLLDAYVRDCGLGTPDPVVIAAVPLSPEALIAAVPLSPEALQATYANATQATIDAAAASRGYADGVACASYAASTISAWREEATAFIAWRDSVWTYVLTALSEAKSSGITPNITDFMSKIPVIVWP